MSNGIRLRKSLDSFQSNPSSLDSINSIPVISPDSRSGDDLPPEIDVKLDIELQVPENAE